MGFLVGVVIGFALGWLWSSIPDDPDLSMWHAARRS